MDIWSGWVEGVERGGGDWEAEDRLKHSCEHKQQVLYD